MGQKPDISSMQGTGIHHQGHAKDTSADRQSLLADVQHRFHPGRSCATRLLLAYEEWSGMIEEGELVDVLYLDFAKAFNTIPIRKLLNKVKAHRIDRKILCWIEAFLVGHNSGSS